MNMKKTQGFTLIELMIVIAIIAILAAIALPAYQDYTTRAKISELIVAADACKNSVTEYFQARGALPANTVDAGCDTQTTQYVASLGVAAGVITVATAAAPAIPAAAQGNYVLSPAPNAANASILDWSCDAAAGTTINPKFIPATCR
jgi:type IV pilus assembly protein PilA